jgi:hypothetical protein
VLATITFASAQAVTQSGTWNIGTVTTVSTVTAVTTVSTVTTVTTVSTVTNLSQLGGQAIAMGTGTRSSGPQRVTIATDDVVPASQSGTWTVQPGNTANTTPWLVTDTPATSGGLSVSRVIDFSGSNQGQTSVKGIAGQVYGVIATNTNAAVRYLKLYNASAPTSASTPVLTIAVPGNTAGAGVVMNFDKGIAFGSAIGMRATTGAADNDTGSVSANEVIANILYK